jgi:N-acylglucosamine 2-epimerase
MNRRAFVGSAGTGTLGLFAACQNRRQPPAGDIRLGGMTLEELRRKYRQELFEVMLPFWDKHGVDHERGGVMHGLDYDGTLAHSQKLMWFQGRAIWIYSFLYNHFGGDARHLEIARKTRDFVLQHARQPDGWWAELLDRDGKALRPFRGDVYGMYFAAEGLQEYAWAAKDEQSYELALALMKQLHRHIENPKLEFPGMPAPGARPQGLWMVNLRTATQMLARWRDSEIEEIAQKAVDAVIHKHYNPDIGLNNEDLGFDFSRIKGEENKSLLGHSIETLWMVMDEALRTNDLRLWELCAERIHRHIEVGWDHVFGGLAQWVNVDQGGYQWPVEKPVGTDLEFRFVGEYQYMKPLWALKEVLVACLNTFERNQAEWAARFFGLAQEVIDTKFSRRQHGQPGYMLFGDRRMTPQPHVARQDNYHPPRQLMLNLLTLDRMLAA